ncbi:MAG TPA: sigma-70 family RNA polymerase sigma factor [Actinomycetes bacterium]|nr:sigma-70 family RNA polymerase sigma factor [Actinomycetes bacterium]
MTTVGRDALPQAPTPAVGVEDDWVTLLRSPGPDRDAALRRLHQLLLRAARHQVWSMRTTLPARGPEHIEEIANQAADEAMVALLAKLGSFEGRSRFTTWAYKFAVLHAAVEVRRVAWRGREVALLDAAELPEETGSPADYAEAADLARAVRAGIETALTGHQRRIMLTLLVEAVPIDVLAERLGTSRNALYKTLHDARRRLRAHLIDAGYLTVAAPATTTSRGTR